MLIHLPSVASYIDTDSFNMFAAYQRGGYDKDSATPLVTCSQTWFNC